MIITRQKPFKQVQDALSGCKTVAVLGCGRCATSCGTGGEPQVKKMTADLRNVGFTVVGGGVVEAQCDLRLSKRVLHELADCDAILTLSCGSGAQAVAELASQTVIAGNDTLFLGVVKPGGVFEERCSMCGQCLLNETGGVCPITRCSKGILHGPCGGSCDGVCEVDSLQECAWALIHERLARVGSQSTLKPPRDNLREHRPRKARRSR